MIGTGTLFLDNFLQNEIIKWVHHSHQSVQNWHLINEVGYNKCKISGSQQCILGQAKLDMLLVHLTLCKIIIHDFSIYFRQLTWQSQDCQKHFARILLKWDMDIGKILFTLSYVKYKQFDFSLLVNIQKNLKRIADVYISSNRFLQWLQTILMLTGTVYHAFSSP